MLSKDYLSEEAIYEFDRIKGIEQKINRDDSIYKTGDRKMIKHLKQ